MQVGNLSVSNFFFFMVVMWAILCLHNRQSSMMLVSLLSYEAIQAVTTTNFTAYLACSTLYFYFAQSNIKFLSTFRKAFIAFGVVYFIGAIDQAIYYHFDYDTYFDRMQPYLITIINAYVLASLIDGGGKQDAGLADYISATFHRWLARLS